MFQEPNAFSQPNREQNTSCVQRFNSMPSTSKFGCNLNSNENKILKSSICMTQNNTQRKDMLHLKDTSTIMSGDYKEFEDKLINRRVHNSTFKLDNNGVLGNIRIILYILYISINVQVIVSGSEYVKELEKLKVENRKLLDDFITKEGEAVFLRNQLQQTQLRAENDKLEKTRFIEEQENRHRTEINAICKEKEYLKTQLELQVCVLISIIKLDSKKLYILNSNNSSFCFTDI